MLVRERPFASVALPAPAPLPSLASAFSRRAALFGAVSSVGVLAGAATVGAADIGMPMTASRVAAPLGPLTLQQAEEVDFAALWRSLPSAAQTRIGALALRIELLQQLEVDGGFHTAGDDRDAATELASDAREDLERAIWAAAPGVMPAVYDEPYPLWQVLDDRAPPAEVDVRGMGMCALVREEWQWFARDGEQLLELGGAVDLDNAVEGAPCRWQFWTVADIDAERLRRHPEIADRREAA